MTCIHFYCSIMTQRIFLIIIVSAAVTGSEYDNETPPNYEYIQIFKNIPTLFEYLLDMLEERPEILEKDDVTIFTKRNVDVGTDSNRDGRETKVDGNCIDTTGNSVITINTVTDLITLYSDQYTVKSDTTNHDNIFDNDDAQEDIKRNPIVAPIISKDKSDRKDKIESKSIDDEAIKDLEDEGYENKYSTDFNSNNKRDIYSDSTEKQYTTVLHEYGHSFQVVKKNAIEKDANEMNAENKKSKMSDNANDPNKLFKRNGVNLTEINNLDKSVKNKGGNKRKTFDVEEDEAKNNGRRSIDFESFRGSFLTPEDIEEQMVKVEQMLEKHNKDKKK